MEQQGLASELLHEVKLSTRRWFFIAMAELIVIAILVSIIFLVPVEETSTTIEQEADNAGYNQVIGGDYGSETESDQNLQETQRNEKAP